MTQTRAAVISGEGSVQGLCPAAISDEGRAQAPIHIKHGKRWHQVRAADERRPATKGL